MLIQWKNWCTLCDFLQTPLIRSKSTCKAVSRKVWTRGEIETSDPYQEFSIYVLIFQYAVLFPLEPWNTFGYWILNTLQYIETILLWKKFNVTSFSHFYNIICTNHLLNFHGLSSRSPSVPIPLQIRIQLSDRLPIRSPTKIRSRFRLILRRKNIIEGFRCWIHARIPGHHRPRQWRRYTCQWRWWHRWIGRGTYHRRPLYIRLHFTHLIIFPKSLVYVDFFFPKIKFVAFQ